MSKHSYMLDLELEIDVTFNYSPPIPETGPSYSSGGEPAEPAEVDITEILIEDIPISGKLFSIIAEKLLDNYYEDFCNSAEEE